MVICNEWTKHAETPQDGPVLTLYEALFILQSKLVGLRSVSRAARAGCDQCLCLADRARGPCSRGREGEAEDG